MTTRTPRPLHLTLLAVVLATVMVAPLAAAPATGPADGAPAADTAADADALLADALSTTSADGVAMAGVASVDTSWHLGASGGQFADTDAPIDPEFVDPHAHAVRKEPTEEIGSRIVARALVVQGADGNRVAVVGNDLYLPNDLLNRRVAQLVQAHDEEVAAGLVEGPVVGITDETLAMTVSHNHNSAFYSTPSWGTWIFQDVFDIRFFDYYAERMAQAVIDAAADMRPVRMGAATLPFNEIQAHTYGPKVAIDGTPAGQPWSHTTGQLSVVRFDDITDPANPDPYAAWVVLGIHPEWTWGYDVYNGDVTHAAMRVIDRELGVTTVMSQRETGSSGPHRHGRVHEGDERREFQDNGFGNLDVAARLWADRVSAAYDAIAAGTPVQPFDPVHQPLAEGDDVTSPIARVDFSSSFTVDAASQRFAPPTMRPVPGISNCNTAQLFHGDIQLPILGFPDCAENPDSLGVTDPVVDPLFGAVSDATGTHVTMENAGNHVVAATPVDERAMYDQLRAAGVPIPDSYTGTALTAVEETAAVHIMAFRLGDLAVTFCPCEQFSDTALNVQTRLDDVAGNVWIGWDWESQLTPTGRSWCIPTPGVEAMMTCADPRDPATDLDPVPLGDVERMRAQIRNDAAGWETDAGSMFGEAEAPEPVDILGNFTHAEVPEHGYPMVVSVGMANDYFGYVPNYREMRAHEHYRKALNGLGLHGADYLANRMVALGASLNGGPAVELSPADLAYQAESARALATATALGEVADAWESTYAASLPADGGTPAVIAQPGDITRFDAAEVRWVGGSNYTDMPLVEVQRLEGGEWVTVGDMHGEVQARLDFPSPAELPAVETGTFEWVWTAQMEAFVADRDGEGGRLWLPEVDGTQVQATPVGTYRFAMTGHHRTGPGDAVEAYALTSEPFAVGVWDGITADVSTDGDDVVVTVGPRSEITMDDGATTYAIGPIDYPDSYDSSFAYVQGPERRRFTYGPGQADDEWYCPFCRFRPWAESADAARVVVTLDGPGGTRDVPAEPLGDGRWVVRDVLTPNTTAVVTMGNISDAWGNINGVVSNRVGG